MITSTSSAQVKHVMALLSKAKARRESEEYVVEGARMVAEVPADRLVKVYLSESYAATHGNSYGDAAETVSDSVFKHMSDTTTPQGIMAVVKMRRYALDDILGAAYKKNPLIICTENLQDPGNLGTIIRMGEAAGVSGIIMSADCVDVYNPKVIRSTMGSMFRVPFICAEDFVGTLDKMRDAGIHLYAAHLGGKADYTDMDYTASSAFLIGNEGNGLTDVAAAKADTLVKIPMCGQVESLNAAIACTVLAFEAARQRRI